MTQAHTTPPTTQAQQLVQEVQEAFAHEIASMAQTLVDAGDDLFGQTEFEIRERVLKLARILYQKRLHQKKTATQAPPKPAPTAKAPPISKGTGPETS